MPETGKVPTGISKPSVCGMSYSKSTLQTKPCSRVSVSLSDIFIVPEYDTSITSNVRRKRNVDPNCRILTSPKIIEDKRRKLGATNDSGIKQNRASTTCKKKTTGVSKKTKTATGKKTSKSEKTKMMQTKRARRRTTARKATTAQTRGSKKRTPAA